jgi:hypothetical protein
MALRSEASRNSTGVFVLLARLVPTICVSVQFAMAQQACVSPPSGMIASWPFDETSGTIAADIVGTKSAAHFGSPSPAPGRVGGSLRFNGSTDFAAAGDSDLCAFGSGNFTIEFWANFASPGGEVHPSHIFIGNDEGPVFLNKWFFALGGGLLNFHVNGTPLGPVFFPLVHSILF